MDISPDPSDSELIIQVQSLATEFNTKYIETNRKIRREGILDPQICIHCPNKEISSVTVLDQPEYDPQDFVTWMETHGVSQIYWN